MIRRFAFAAMVILSMAAFPVNTGLVTDTAGVFTPEEKARLEQKLRDFEQKTSVEFAVVTVTSLDGMDIDQYRVKLFEAWGIGKKDKDNGLLMVVAPNEPPTGKVGIEVGYGLEGLLNDGAVGAIIRNNIRPGWRSAHRADGIFAGVDAIIAHLAQRPPEAAIQRTPEPEDRGMSWGWWLLLVLSMSFVVSVLLIWIWPRKPEPRPEPRRRPTPPPVPPVDQRYTFTPPRPRKTVINDESARRMINDAAAIAAAQADAAERRRRDDEEDENRRRRQRESSHSSWDSGSSSSSFGSSSSSSFDFGGGSSGGGGSSSDL